MIKAHNYQSVCSDLAEAFRTRYRGKSVNITGLIFARPESPLAKEEVIPNIEYWHHRSDFFTDFYCAGFGAYGGRKAGPRDAKRLKDVHHADWWYSSSSFNAFLNEIESRTTWKYRGGTDIIVVNARYESQKDSAWLDFTSAVAINLERAKKDEAIRDVPELAETVFAFAKNLNESRDLVWVYSDKRGFLVLRDSLKNLLLSFLPEALRPGAKKAFHFVAADISKHQ